MRFVLSLLLAAIPALACAQAYPVKAIRLIVPYPPGGSNDVMARGVSAGLGARLGQSVVVDNRGGGGSTLGTNAAAKSAPDGYTLLLVSMAYPANIGLGQLPTDSMKSFTPVALLATGPSVLVVNEALPVGSVAELIALAKREPGTLNAGAAGIGSFQHLATELFKLQAGVDVVIVQYKGGGPALTDLIAGQVQMSVGGLVQIVPHIRSGKLKALGVGGSKRSRALPDVPTIAEAGVPGYEANNWWGILAPAGTSAAIVNRLHNEITALLASPELQRRFELEGAEAVRMSPAEFGEFITAETAKWTRVVKEAGIKPE